LLRLSCVTVQGNKNSCRQEKLANNSHRWSKG
jgi:hypothetical protein